MQDLLNGIREIFFKEIIGNINLYIIISFIFKFIIVFIVLYFIYTIVKLIIVDIKNIDYSYKKYRYFLEVSDVLNNQRLYQLEKINTIGRAFTNDIILDSPLVSKEHAKIIESNGSFYLIDNNSSNGILLNGEKVDDNIELIDGDIIEIGEYILRFERQEVKEDFVEEKIHE